MDHCFCNEAFLVEKLREVELRLISLEQGLLIRKKNSYSIVALINKNQILTTKIEMYKCTVKMTSTP